MKNNHRAGIICLLALCACARAAQYTNDGSIYQPVAVTQDISWTDANAAALAAGGHLVTITSPQESAFVFSIIQNDNSMWNPVGSIHGPWIGLFQPPGSPEPGGGWTWVTGESYGFSMWRGGEPNNAGGTEHFVHLIGTSGVPSPNWNDLPDLGAPGGAGVRSYIIEFAVVPEPSTVALLALGTLGMLVRFRGRPRNPAPRPVCKP